MDATDRRRLDAHMAALADGDRSAFDPVFDLAAPLCQRFAARALGGSPDAEDVAQTALLKVFARAGEYDVDRPALPWILGIVANEVRTHRKRAARRREGPGPSRLRRDALGSSPPSVEEPDRAPSPEDVAVERDLVRAAEAIVDGLSPLDREALEAAIGRRERLGGATFRKRLSRALTRLRHAWKEAHDG